MSEGISLVNAYKANSNYQWELALQCLNEFHFDTRDQVLDVGCRDGRITAFVADKIPEGFVIGLDVSEEMIFEANSLFHQKNLSFLKASPEKIPFVSQFDKLISMNSIHWVLDQKKALNSMRESLKPGGLMLLVLPAKSTDHISKLAHSEKWRSEFPSFKSTRVYHTPEEYAALLSECHLQIESLKVFVSTGHYKDAEDLANWLRPLVNCIDHLPEERQNEFIRDLTRELILSNEQAPDGSIAIGINTMQIIAKKVAITDHLR